MTSLRQWLGVQTQASLGVAVALFLCSPMGAAVALADEPNERGGRAASRAGTLGFGGLTSNGWPVYIQLAGNGQADREGSGSNRAPCSKGGSLTVSDKWTHVPVRRGSFKDHLPGLVHRTRARRSRSTTRSPGRSTGHGRRSPGPGETRWSFASPTARLTPATRGPEVHGTPIAQRFTPAAAPIAGRDRGRIGARSPCPIGQARATNGPCRTWRLVRCSPATGSRAVAGRGGMGIVYRATDLALDRRGGAEVHRRRAGQRPRVSRALHRASPRSPPRSTTRT